MASIVCRVTSRPIPQFLTSFQGSTNSFLVLLLMELMWTLSISMEEWSVSSRWRSGVSCCHILWSAEMTLRGLQDSIGSFRCPLLSSMPFSWSQNRLEVGSHSGDSAVSSIHSSLAVFSYSSLVSFLVGKYDVTLSNSSGIRRCSSSPIDVPQMVISW